MKNILFTKKDMEQCVKEFYIKKENFHKKRITEQSSIDLDSIKKSVNLFLK